MKKWISLLAVAALTLALFAGCGKGGQDTGGKAAIKIGETTLHTNYIDKRIEQIFNHNQVKADDPVADYYKSQIVTGLVHGELIKQETERRGLKITDEDLKKMKEKSIESYGSEEAFKSYLEKYKISDEDFNEMMKEQLRYEKLNDDLRKDIKVDAESYYNENKDQFNVPEQVKASHILVKDEAKAKELIEKLNKGEDFAKLAKENSEDPGSKDKGGELGLFSKDMMVPAFSDAAFAMKVGDISTEPVKTDFGYHIIKVEDHQQAHQQTFDEVKKQIEDQLAQDEVAQKLQKLMDKLKKETKIEYLLDEYNPDKLMEKAQKAMEKSQAEAAQGSAVPAEVAPEQADKATPTSEK